MPYPLLASRACEAWRNNSISCKKRTIVLLLIAKWEMQLYIISVMRSQNEKWGMLDDFRLFLPLKWDAYFYHIDLYNN
jgi:hypothetical protein